MTNSYDPIAGEYNSARTGFREKQYLDLILGQIHPQSKILDLGCGTGLPITAYLTKAGHEVTGVDASQAMLDLARSQVPQAKFILRDMLSVDFDQSVEAIIAWDSIFHIKREKHSSLFDECYRWLKSNGFLLVSLGGSEWEGASEMHGQTFFYSGYAPEKSIALIQQSSCMYRRGDMVYHPLRYVRFHRRTRLIPLFKSSPARSPISHSQIHIPGSESYNKTWLDSALGFIAHEAVAGKAGSLAIINRLSEIIFIQVIRAFADASQAQIPFLAALSDPQISQALSEIHAQPASYLTVEKLGRMVGMSRSAFSNRFSELVGMTPHQYLTLIRLQRAAYYLATTEDSLLTITEAVGYQSEAAFSTAFKRHFGIRPGQYRQKHQEA